MNKTPRYLNSPSWGSKSPPHRPHTSGEGRTVKFCEEHRQVWVRCKPESIPISGGINYRSSRDMGGSRRMDGIRYISLQSFPLRRSAIQPSEEADYRCIYLSHFEWNHFWTSLQKYNPFPPETATGTFWTHSRVLSVLQGSRSASPAKRWSPPSLQPLSTIKRGFVQELMKPNKKKNWPSPQHLFNTLMIAKVQPFGWQHNLSLRSSCPDAPSSSSVWTVCWPRSRSRVRPEWLPPPRFLYSLTFCRVSWFSN